MSYRPTSSRRGTGTNPPLSIVPPSPSFLPPPPAIATPSSSYHPHSTLDAYSPRRGGGGGGGGGTVLPPSPTHTVPWLDDRRSNSLDIPRGNDMGPPPPAVGGGLGKRLPGLQGLQGSPSRRAAGGAGPGGMAGGGAGAYDNKLVSSTLSHLPPIPLSPTPTGNSSHHPSFSSQHPSIINSSSAYHPPPASLLHPLSSTLSNTSLASQPRPSLSSASSVVVLPDGTTLSHDGPGEGARSVLETLAHSSASSPWSVLTVHALPLFAGSHLKTPIEDLNQLCHSHIIATSQRAAASRIVAVLSSDLREFVGSGMLTLKSKFETLEESKIIIRAAEVWSFFWAQILPYLEGVFLPFTQIRETLPSLNAASSSASTSHPHTSLTQSPIPVRHLLLSGFLIHILLPLLPRLLPLLTLQSQGASTPSAIHPSPLDLQRILQMSLVLSTQARYSSIIHSDEPSAADDEVRGNVESLGRAVRWRTAYIAELAERERSASSPEKSAGPPTARPAADGSWASPMPSQQRASLQRGASISGRLRRRGWRASSNINPSAIGWGQPPEHNAQMAPSVSSNNSQYHPGYGGGGGGTQPVRQNSELLQAPEQRWGRPRVDEEDEEDEDITPGATFASAYRPGAGGGGGGGNDVMSTYASSGGMTLGGGSTVGTGGSTLRDQAAAERTPVMGSGVGAGR